MSAVVPDVQQSVCMLSVRAVRPRHVCLPSFPCEAHTVMCTLPKDPDDETDMSTMLTLIQEVNMIAAGTLIGLQVRLYFVVCSCETGWQRPVVAQVQAQAHACAQASATGQTQWRQQRTCAWRSRCSCLSQREDPPRPCPVPIPLLGCECAHEKGTTANGKMPGNAG